MKTSLLLSIAACTVLAIGVATPPVALAQDDDPRLTIVIMIGAHTTMLGFSGDAAPRATLPTIVGTPKTNSVMVGMSEKDRYFGDEALSKQGILNLSRIFRRGQFFASSETVYSFFLHLFYNEIRVAPEEHNVLIAMADVVEEGPTRILLRLLFEEFNVPQVYVASLAQLALYASGRTTGLVVHMTHEGGHIVPVIEGYVMPTSVVALPVGLDRQAEYMRQILLKRGYEISDRFVLEDIVGSTTYVAADYDAEMQKEPGSVGVMYQMADGTSLALDRERFLTPETLFQPTLASMRACGLVDCIAQSVASIDIDKQREMLGNVVLLGAGSMTPGLVPRLRSELQTRFPPPVKLIASPERDASPWIGGSILASLSTFQSLWISKAEFEDGQWWAKLTNPY